MLHLQSQSFFIKFGCLPALLAQLEMLSVCAIDLDEYFWQFFLNQGL